MNDSDSPSGKDHGPNSLESHIRLDGREEKKTAETAIPVSAPPAEHTHEAPHSEINPPRALGPVKQFYRDLIDVLTEPKSFFHSRYPQISFNYALTFGIIVSWIAAFLDWMTRIVRHETFLDSFLKLKDTLQDLPFWKALPDNFWAQTATENVSLFPAWVAELLGIALSPFQSLLGFCVSGFILFLGAYFLVPRDETDHPRDNVKISLLIKLVCLAAAPRIISSILGFLPFGMGSFIGSIYGVVLTIVGLIERFRVSGLRACGIMILPGILVVFVMSCMIGAFAGILFGLFAALFGSH